MRTARKRFPAPDQLVVETADPRMAGRLYASLWNLCQIGKGCRLPASRSPEVAEACSVLCESTRQVLDVKCLFDAPDNRVRAMREGIERLCSEIGRQRKCRAVADLERNRWRQNGAIECFFSSAGDFQDERSKCLARRIANETDGAERLFSEARFPESGTCFKKLQESADGENWERVARKAMSAELETRLSDGDVDFIWNHSRWIGFIEPVNSALAGKCRSIVQKIQDEKKSGIGHPTNGRTEEYAGANHPNPGELDPTPDWVGPW